MRLGQGVTEKMYICNAMKKQLLWGMSLLFVVSCNTGHETEMVRGAYYWSTTFALDSTQQAFLSTHRISRLYVRYFDVVDNREGQAVPNATIDFRSAIPKGIEIVPTIYILNDCMRHEVPDLAEKLLKRVLQMNETNDIPKIRELQIDCDWTASTRQRYYDFLRELRERAAQQGIVLSTTIRLHQLSMEVPPVERGTLMMYNTGDFRRLDDHKPILDMAVVRPYLRHLKRYALTLNTAYPLFKFRLLFRRGRFVGVIHSKDEYPILSTDTIITRMPALGDIIDARNAVEAMRPDANNEIILYDMSTDNLTRFNPSEYEKIYHP